MPIGNLQREIGVICDPIFPNATNRGRILKLQKEAQELLLAFDAEDFANLQEEAADCALILFHLAHKAGFQLERAMRNKLSVLKTRKWKFDGEGQYSHMKEGE